MKKLVKLDDRVPTFTDEQKAETMPTYRSLIKSMVTNSVPKNNEESVELNQIIMKLKLVEPEIDFENSEFKVIIEKFDTNQVKMFAGFHSPVVAYLKEIEKTGENK